MLDQLIGVFMLGLGMKTPNALPGQIRGDSIEVKDGTSFMQEQKKEEVKKAAETAKESVKKLQETKREAFKTARENVRETFKTSQENLREAVKTKKEEVRENAKTKREEIRETAKNAREALKSAREDEQNEATSARELKRGEFQKKLSEITDTRKKKLVTQTLTKMTNLNAKRTKEMSTTLARMQKVLENVSAKALALQNSGKDVQAVLDAYGTAQTAVTNASLAVSAQAGKSYDMSSSPGSDVKSDVDAGVKSLETDISGVKTQMKAAKQAVYAAVKALSQVTGVK